MKLFSINENANLPFEPSIDVPGRKPLKNASLAELLDDKTQPTRGELIRSHEICRMLYNNKQLRDSEPNRTNFKKITCAYGPRDWIVFTDGITAYILMWHNQNKYWFDTHL